MSAVRQHLDRIGRGTLNYIRQNRLTLIALLVLTAIILYQRIPLYQEKRQLLDRPAPDFVLETLDGEVVRLSDFEGQDLILNFWATWCIPCRVEVPILNRISARVDQSKLTIFAIAAEDESLVRRYAEEKNLNYTVLLDRTGEVSALYRVMAYPTNIFIDSAGQINSVEHGLSPLLPLRMGWKYKTLIY